MLCGNAAHTRMAMGWDCAAHQPQVLELTGAMRHKTSQPALGCISNLLSVILCRHDAGNGAMRGMQISSACGPGSAGVRLSGCFHVVWSTCKAGASKEQLLTEVL